MVIGWNESICLANATILVDDQRDIGVAGGTAGSVRAAICAVLVAIYTTIMTNRLSETIPAQVPPAVINAENKSRRAAFSFGPVGFLEFDTERKPEIIVAGMRAANSGVHVRYSAI